jgi:hypothetical protein
VINFNIKEIHTDFLRKIIGYIRCTGGDLWQFQIGLYYKLVISPLPFSPSAPSLPHFKQLKEVLLFYFIQVYEVHQPYLCTLISFIHSLPATCIPLHTLY